MTTISQPLSTPAGCPRDLGKNPLVDNAIDLLLSACWHVSRVLGYSPLAVIVGGLLALSAFVLWIVGVFASGEKS